MIYLPLCPILYHFRHTSHYELFGMITSLVDLCLSYSTPKFVQRILHPFRASKTFDLKTFEIDQRAKYLHIPNVTT